LTEDGCLVPARGYRTHTDANMWVQKYLYLAHSPNQHRLVVRYVDIDIITSIARSSLYVHVS
jgi:hypothetical protein